MKDKLFKLLAVGGINILRGIALILPTRLFLAACGRIGWFAGRFFGKESAISITQLRFALGSRHSVVQRLARLKEPKHTLFGSPQEVKIFEPLVLETFAHAAKSVAEFLILDKLLRHKIPGEALPTFRNIQAHGTDYAAEQIAQGKTVLALSAHLGNFELLAAYHVACGFKISVVARDPNLKALNPILTRLRGPHGIQTIWRDEPGSGRRLIHAFKEPQILALLIDQDVQLENLFSPFFGLEAACPVTLINLAVKFELPVVTSFIVRTGPTEHRIVTEPALYEPRHPHAAQTIIDQYNRRLEAQLREYPNQWFWWHRRWRRRPGIDYDTNPEMLRSTHDYISWLRSLTPEDR